MKLVMMKFINGYHIQVLFLYCSFGVRMTVIDIIHVCICTSITVCLT